MCIRDRIEAEVSAPATGQVGLTISKPLSGGRHFADVKLTTGGKALDWATIGFEREAKATITSLKLSSEQVKLGETVSAQVRVKTSLPRDCTIVARLFDNYNR